MYICKYGHDAMIFILAKPSNCNPISTQKYLWPQGGDLHRGETITIADHGPCDDPLPAPRRRCLSRPARHYIAV
jgi:hypothetical protein